MKQKAIDVKYRKTSESFPDYLKYEITVLGITEIVPENDFFDYEAKYLGKSKERIRKMVNEN